MFPNLDPASIPSAQPIGNLAPNIQVHSSHVIKCRAIILVAEVQKLFQQITYQSLEVETDHVVIISR